MRCRRLELSIDQAKQIFAGLCVIDFSRYPDDTRIIRIHFDQVKKMYFLILSSKEYPDLDIVDYCSNEIETIKTHFVPQYPIQEQYVLMLQMLFPILVQDYVQILPDLQKLPEQEQVSQMTNFFKVRVSEYMKAVSEMEGG